MQATIYFINSHSYVGGDMFCLDQPSMELIQFNSLGSFIYNLETKVYATFVVVVQVKCKSV